MRIERLKKVQRFVNDRLEVSNEPCFKHKSSDFCAFSAVYQAVSISRCFVLVWWIKCKCWLGLQIPQQWLKEGEKGPERGNSFGSKKRKTMIFVYITNHSSPKVAEPEMSSSNLKIRTGPSTHNFSISVCPLEISWNEERRIFWEKNFKRRILF